MSEGQPTPIEAAQTHAETPAETATPPKPHQVFGVEAMQLHLNNLNSRIAEGDSTATVDPKKFSRLKRERERLEKRLDYLALFHRAIV